MHGLKTIRQLNDIATQNAQAKQILEAAEASRLGKPNQLDRSLKEYLAGKEVTPLSE